MPRSGKTASFILLPIISITLKKSKRSRVRIRLLRSPTLISICRRADLRSFSSKKARQFTGWRYVKFRRCNNFALPTFRAKTQRYRAGLVLAKELDLALPQILGPAVANPLVTGEVAGSSNDQARPRSIEERAGAGLSGMMLTFNDDVAVEI